MFSDKAHWLIGKLIWIGSEQMTKKDQSNLVKIVYFDEQAAIDALQVVDGGSALETLSKTLEKGNAIDADGNVGKSVLGLMGLGLKGNARREKNTIIQSQVTSTLISQFIEKVSDNKISLLTVNKPNLRIQKDSVAYFRNLLPMTHMVNDFSALEDVDEDSKRVLAALNFDQLGDSLDTFSAYYELEGIFEERSAIFRFNIDGLRNNYSLLDLAKIDCLKVYGLTVGYRDSMDLSFDKQVDDLVAEVEDDVEYDDFKNKENVKNKVKEVYPMIDVILAGIESWKLMYSLSLNLSSHDE